MGQALFFPQQAAAATPAADSGKDSSRPKSKPSRSPAEPVPTRDKPAAPTKSPDPPKKSRSPAPPQRPLTALTPSLLREQGSPLSPPRSYPPPEKAKEPSPPHLLHFKRDWRRPWGGAVGEQPKPPVPSRASPAHRVQPQGPARSERTPPPPPPPPPSRLADMAPQCGDSDSDKGRTKSPVPVFEMPLSFVPPKKPPDLGQPRFQFGKNLEFDAFLASLQSQSAARKTVSVEECSLKGPTAAEDKGPKTGSPFKQPSLTPSPFQPPSLTPSPFQPPSLTPSPFQPPSLTPSPFQPPSLTPSPFKQPSQMPSPIKSPSQTPSPIKSPSQKPSPIKSPSQMSLPFKLPSQTPSPIKLPSQTPSPIKPQSQTPSPIKLQSQTPSPIKQPSLAVASPARSAKAGATCAISGTGLEKQSPSRTSVKQAPAQAARPAAATPAPSEQGSFELLISSAGGAEGGAAGAAVEQRGAARAVSSAERERRVKRLRKRQSEMAAARRGKAPPPGAETKQDAARAADTAKPPPDAGPDLSIQGASPVFSVPPPRPLPPPPRPVPPPPTVFAFSSNARKPEAKPAKEAAKGVGPPAHAQFSPTGPSPPKFSFSFGLSSSPKPQKLAEAPSNSSLAPIQEGLSRARGWSSTTIDSTSTLTSTAATETSGSPSADPPHAPPQKARTSPATPLKAKRKLLKGAPSVTAAQHKQENEEEKSEQASSASASPPPKPPAHSPGAGQPPASPATPDTPAKPKKKLRFKIPFELRKGEAKAVTVVRAEKKETKEKKEKKEKKERSKEAVPALPASPPSPEGPQRPSRGWPPFAAEQGCSRKARCRHQSGAELPRNVTRWLNVRPNYLCEPPWVTTATLAASVALILRQDGTYNQQ